MENTEIVNLVADTFGVSAVRLCSKDRSKEITNAKIAYCGLVRDLQKVTTINLLLGISAPSVRKYIDLCDDMLQKDETFKEKYNKAYKQIANE